MVSRKRLDGAAQRWVGDAESVWTGMADWRAAHPKATLSEIEAALDERLNQVRARVLADLALAPAASGVAGAAAAERGVWGEQQARGPSERALLTRGGAEVRRRRSYAACPAC